MLSTWLYTPDVPQATGLVDYFGTAGADSKQNNRNFARVRSPVVDDLIGRIRNARTTEELTAYSRVLDRVLLAESYYVPMGALGKDRVAYKGLCHPDKTSSYYGIDAWSWWSCPAEGR